MKKNKDWKFLVRFRIEDPTTIINKPAKEIKKEIVEEVNKFSDEVVNKIQGRLADIYLKQIESKPSPVFHQLPK